MSRISSSRVRDGPSLSTDYAAGNAILGLLEGKPRHEAAFSWRPGFGDKGKHSPVS